MKIYLGQNVFDAALDRIRWIFSEFKNISICISGGKDSTVVLNLALRVAEETERLPLNVMFIDQEAEWGTVINYIRGIMQDPRVNPQWYQMPLEIFNATSSTTPWLKCWQDGKAWMRDKEPGSIKENRFGTDRFKDLFTAILRVNHPGEPACHIGGVTCEESPVRWRALTCDETYKGVTWGKVESKILGHYLFYPLYDWSVADVWKAIHDNAWPYCPIYDYMYQHSVPLIRMRVSNVHHETAIHQLFYLQEIEGDTWEKLTQRLSGINTAGKLPATYFPGSLPPMFGDWPEYRDHLLENLITDEVIKDKFRRQFQSSERRKGQSEDLFKAQIATILTNDYHGTKMANFLVTQAKNEWKRRNGRTA